MKRVSLRLRVDAKCRDCGGADGGVRHWRNHVSVCPVTDCPLWSCRPLTRENPPDWIVSRDPARLPPGFEKLSTDQALAMLKGACGSDPARNGADQSGSSVSGPTDQGHAE